MSFTKPSHNKYARVYPGIYIQGVLYEAAGGLFEKQRLLGTGFRPWRLGHLKHPRLSPIRGLDRQHLRFGRQRWRLPASRTILHLPAKTVHQLGRVRRGNVVDVDRVVVGRGHGGGDNVLVFVVGGGLGTDVFVKIDRVVEAGRLFGSPTRLFQPSAARSLGSAVLLVLEEVGQFEVDLGAPLVFQP